jgi:hypothetical protein
MCCPRTSSFTSQPGKAISVDFIDSSLLWPARHYPRVRICRSSIERQRDLPPRFMRDIGTTRLAALVSSRATSRRLLPFGAFFASPANDATSAAGCAMSGNYADMNRHRDFESAEVYESRVYYSDLGRRSS